MSRVASVTAIPLDCEFARTWSRYLDQFGRDHEVREIAASLMHRFMREIDAAVVNKVQGIHPDYGARHLIKLMDDFISFHGPHLWAALGTEAGIRASVLGRQAAEGSYVR